MYSNPSETRSFLKRVAVSGVVLGSFLALGGLPSAQTPVAPAQTPSGLGRTPTPAELRAWDIAVSPDGSELPPGSGSATQGALVFTQRDCTTCHGPTAKEGPAPVLVGATASKRTSFFPINYWPFAPKIF